MSPAPAVAASGATKVAKVATVAKPAVAGEVAPVVHAVASGGFSGTGWIGMGAGAAGLVITLLDQWKQSTGSGKGFSATELLNPTTLAIGGGAALLTMGEKTFASSAFMQNGLRGAGLALLAGGLVGAIAGAINTFGNDLLPKTEQGMSSQSQAPTRYSKELPAAPANLNDVEVASADVIGEAKSLNRVSVYVDPTAPTALPEDTTLGEAIGQARAETQADAKDRSHAVIKTKDGAYWVVPLTGDLDQVDGPAYSTGTKFDDRYDPQIGRRQQAVQAIAGVETYYVFPESTEATAPDQYTGDIPWVTPKLSTAKTTPAKEAPKEAPATEAPATTTPSEPATTTGEGS